MWKYSRYVKKLITKRNLSVKTIYLHSACNFDISEEVKDGLETGAPIVALESTIITHGMPYPENMKCALAVENIIREQSAIPATIAILSGRITVGLNHEQISYLADTKHNKAVKTSRRDFPYVISKHLNGGTTVSGTIIVAEKIGIPIFVTGGIGGVHREGEKTLDISADLTELGRSSIAVVSAGIKSILDIPRTLEYLETQGVFVATFGATTNFPAFYSRTSGCHAPYNVTNVQQAAEIIKSSNDLGLKSGMLFAVPVPEKEALSEDLIQEAIEQALNQARQKDLEGKFITPFLLGAIANITEGKSLQTNVALIKNNAKVGAQIAVELSHLKSQRKSVNNSNRNVDQLENDIPMPVVIGGSNLDCCASIQDSEIKLSNAASIVDNTDDWESLELIAINEPTQKNIIYDVVEKTQLLLSKIRNYINGKVQIALDHFKNTEVQIRIIIKQAIDAFKPRLQHVIDEAKENIRRLVAELKEDFSYCLGVSETSFKELLKNFLIREEYCVAREFYGAISSVIETVRDVLGAIQKIELLPSKFKKCLKVDIHYDCVKMNVWDPAKMEGKTMKMFVTQVSNGTEIVSGLKTNLSTCATMQITRAANEAVAIVKRFPECFVNKIG